MPIYVYDCPEDGLVDVFFRSYGSFPEWPCPDCGGLATRVATTPALVSVKRDWNDQASDQQRDPYTQSRAQLTNLDRERQEREGAAPMKITEEMIQAGAKAIHEDKRTPPKGAVQRTVAAKNRGRKQTQQT